MMPDIAEAALPVAIIEAMVAGTAPMSKWVASVDYSTYAEFETYLATQLREKLHLKASLDKSRDEKEDLASFVDGGTAALEGALATYRVVREREAALVSSAVPVFGWAWRYLRPTPGSWNFRPNVEHARRPAHEPIEVVDLYASSQDRAAIIEECAKVADAKAAGDEAHWKAAGRDEDAKSHYLWAMQTGQGIAAAIRALIGDKANGH